MLWWKTAVKKTLQKNKTMRRLYAKSTMRYELRDVRERPAMGSTCVSAVEACRDWTILSGLGQYLA